VRSCLEGLLGALCALCCRSGGTGSVPSCAQQASVPQHPLALHLPQSIDGSAIALGSWRGFHSDGHVSAYPSPHALPQRKKKFLPRSVRWRWSRTRERRLSPFATLLTLGNPKGYRDTSTQQPALPPKSLAFQGPTQTRPLPCLRGRMKLFPSGPAALSLRQRCWERCQAPGVAGPGPPGIASCVRGPWPAGKPPRNKCT